MLASDSEMSAQITQFMGSTWGPPGSCRPQMGPMLSPWILLSGSDYLWGTTLGWSDMITVSSPQSYACNLMPFPLSQAGMFVVHEPSGGGSLTWQDVKGTFELFQSRCASADYDCVVGDLLKTLCSMRTNGRHRMDDIAKYIFLHFIISIQSSLPCLPNGQIGNDTASVKEINSHTQQKPLPEWGHRSLTHV